LEIDVDNLHYFILPLFKKVVIMEKTILTFRVDKDLHREFKVQATQEGRTMVTILEELITGYLKNKKKGSDKGTHEKE
jgi:hypothetical protein